MKMNFGKRSVKDVFIGDYDYRFLCMVRTAIHLLSQSKVQRHCTLGPGRSFYRCAAGVCTDIPHVLWQQLNSEKNFSTCMLVNGSVLDFLRAQGLQNKSVLLCSHNLFLCHAATMAMVSEITSQRASILPSRRGPFCSCSSCNGAAACIGNGWWHCDSSTDHWVSAR